MNWYNLLSNCLIFHELFHHLLEIKIKLVLSVLNLLVFKTCFTWRTQGLKMVFSTSPPKKKISVPRLSVYLSVCLSVWLSISLLNSLFVCLVSLGTKGDLKPTPKIRRPVLQVWNRLSAGFVTNVKLKRIV